MVPRKLRALYLSRNRVGTLNTRTAVKSHPWFNGSAKSHTHSRRGCRCVRRLCGEPSQGRRPTKGKPCRRIWCQRCACSYDSCNCHWCHRRLLYLMRRSETHLTLSLGDRTLCFPLLTKLLSWRTNV